MPASLVATAQLHVPCHARNQQRVCRPAGVQCTVNSIARNAGRSALLSPRLSESYQYSRRQSFRVRPKTRPPPSRDVAVRSDSSLPEVSAADDKVSFTELPLTAIRRPLARSRANDPKKVKWLAESIAEIGLQEPIDVLDVEGVYYGFSGCHRYEAHQRLGKETIKCRVIKSTPRTLRMHLM